MRKSIRIIWHRRDLRMKDNHPLFKALSTGKDVVPLFIFDTSILSKLENNADARVSFIHHHLQLLRDEYARLGCGMIVRTGDPLTIWKDLVEEYHIREVFAGRDHEPYAIHRDKSIYDFLKGKSIPFHGYKDHVIFERNEILKDDGRPYTVFTPYSKKWKQKLTDSDLAPFPVDKHLSSLGKLAQQGFPTLEEIGFRQTEIPMPELHIDNNILRKYHETRDIPSVNGTSRMSVHLRFGTISIRELALIALTENEKYLNELIWRDFYQMILFHFPETIEKSFKPAYDRIPWINNESDFAAWCEGKTGYPLVDAGMRELLATGYMHNRVRMVVASFLTKHLLIDWRWGEAFFKAHLLDYECASNVGGWQWAAGSGNDAAPYFRVFNPQSQQEKFDPDFRYIRKWVPEYGTGAYPAPIVDHKTARERVLATYKKALDK